MTIDPKKTSYRSNPNLKRAGVKLNFTQEQLEEYIKCSEDPIYFIEKYFKIVTLDKGLINISLFDYQKDIINMFHTNRFSIVKSGRQSYKCIHYNTKITLNDQIISIGDLYEKFKSNINPNGKFVDSIELQNIQIETDQGFKSISAIHKTIPYEEWIIKTNTKELICADDHVLFDENMNEIFAKNLIPYKSFVQTKTGIELIISVEKTENKSNMYDVTVNSFEHRFYSNDFLSHNTTSTVAYILWASLFNHNYSIAILANKGSLAREILSRYSLALNNLPLWLQQGVVILNKGFVELENGSKVLASATSSSAIRGYSINLCFIDEMAFVPNNIMEEFLSAVFPTISSGTNSKLILSSTPRGLNTFYKYWTEAIRGQNNFCWYDVPYYKVPGRGKDTDFRERTIAQIGLAKFNQEYNSVYYDTKVTVNDTEICIGDLYKQLEN